MDEVGKGDGRIKSGVGKIILKKNHWRKCILGKLK